MSLLLIGLNIPINEFVVENANAHNNIKLSIGVITENAFLPLLNTNKLPIAI